MSSQETLCRNPEWDCILAAAQKNKASEIQRLVQKFGVSPNHTNVAGQSPLHIAALWGNVEATQALLEASAHVNAVNSINGSTPLHCAIQSSRGTKLSRLECIRRIIEVGGADINIPDSYGKTPLDYLNLIEEDEVDREDLDTIEYYKGMRSLLTPPENSDLSMLFHAIEMLDIFQVQNILAQNNGKQILDQFQRRSGLNPLLFAVEKLVNNLNTVSDDEPAENMDAQNILDIINLLLDAGANPNSIRKDKVDQPIMFPTAKVTSEEKVDLALAPIHMLCQILQKLYVTKTANISSSLLILEECILSLKKNGAIVSQDTIYLMHDASRRNNVSFLSFLIEKMEVDPNTKGRQGLTPLHFAARSGHVDAVDYLLNRIPSACLYKVDLNVTDNMGMTALDAARVNMKNSIVELLSIGEEDPKV